MLYYEVLDIFFTIFHSSIIVFNLLGWIWIRTRKANLILLLLTGASWFLLGIWYGIGYCPVTDWHWMVLKELDNTDLPNSYVKFLVDRITGLDVNAFFVDTMVTVFFFAALIVSLYVNFKKKPIAHSADMP